MVDGEGLLNIDEAGRCWFGGYIPSLSPGMCPSYVMLGCIITDQYWNR